MAVLNRVAWEYLTSKVTLSGYLGREYSKQREGQVQTPEEGSLACVQKTAWEEVPEAK